MGDTIEKVRADLIPPCFPGMVENSDNYLIEINNEQIRKEEEELNEFREQVEEQIKPPYQNLDFQGMYKRVQEFLKKRNEEDKI